MKKLGTFVIHSLALFGIYLILTLLATAILQTVLRIFIPAESVGERLWKTLLSYGVMPVVSAIYLKVNDGERKRLYLAATEGTAWDVRSALRYTVRHSDFWLRVVAFAIWPVILPQFFGAINRLYVSAAFLASFPARVLVLATVDMPFLLMQLVAWLIVTRLWSKNRLRG